MLENELVKRMMWTGLVAGVGALSTLAANRVATLIWERFMGEEPPDLT